MKVFSSQYFTGLLNVAGKSPRSRAHANVHDSYGDRCQRFFNAIKADSYIRPHRHSLDPKEECLIAIRGLFGLVIFNDRGLIESITLFGGEKYSESLSIASGIELPAGLWHTIVSLVDESILFEVKSGPFNPSLAKELAPWAVEEGNANSEAYLEFLRRKCLDQLMQIKLRVVLI